MTISRMSTAKKEKKMTHEFGHCYRHKRRWAVVKLQDRPCCLPCFEESMASLGEALRGFRKALPATEASLTISVHNHA